MHLNSVVLDGDVLRCGLNKDLGFSYADRIENIRRVAEVAKLMVKADLLVLAAFITPYQQSRDFIRQLMGDETYYECYLRCPVSICEERDPKGLYKKARAGIITDMIGIQDTYDIPIDPDIVLDTENVHMNECIRQMLDFFKQHRLIP